MKSFAFRIALFFLFIPSPAQSQEQGISPDWRPTSSTRWWRPDEPLTPNRMKNQGWEKSVKNREEVVKNLEEVVKNPDQLFI